MAASARFNVRVIDKKLYMPLSDEHDEHTPDTVGGADAPRDSVFAACKKLFPVPKPTCCGCCGGDPDNPISPASCAGAFLTLAAVLVLVGATLPTMTATLIGREVAHAVDTRMAIDGPNAAGMAHFLDSRSDGGKSESFLNIHVFDLMNAEAVLHGAKPCVRDVGPFVYQIHVQHFDVYWTATDAPDDTTRVALDGEPGPVVRYKTYKWFSFREDLSVGPDDQNVTIISEVYQFIAAAARLALLEDKTFLELIADDGFLRPLSPLEQLSKNVTVREAIFGYDSPILKQAAGLLPAHGPISSKYPGFLGGNNTFDYAKKHAKMSAMYTRSATEAAVSDKEGYYGDGRNICARSICIANGQDRLAVCPCLTPACNATSGPFEVPMWNGLSDKQVHRAEYCGGPNGGGDGDGMGSGNEGDENEKNEDIDGGGSSEPREHPAPLEAVASAAAAAAASKLRQDPANHHGGAPGPFDPNLVHGTLNGVRFCPGVQPYSAKTAWFPELFRTATIENNDPPWIDYLGLSLLRFRPKADTYSNSSDVPEHKAFYMDTTPRGLMNMSRVLDTFPMPVSRDIAMVVCGSPSSLAFAFFVADGKIDRSLPVLLRFASCLLAGTCRSRTSSTPTRPCARASTRRGTASRRPTARATTPRSTSSR